MLNCTSLGLNNGPSPWDQSNTSSWECAKCISPASYGSPTEPPCYYYLDRGESLGFARRRFIQDPIDVYLVSLFVTDAIQALGSVLSVIQELGITVVAWSTWAIAGQTFVVLWWGFDRIHLMWPAWVITGLIWLFVALWVIIGPLKNTHYMMPSPYWCWIGKNHLGDQLGGQYVWYWTTLLFSVLVYVLLFFKQRGNVATSRYPFVYGFLILPLTGVRLNYFVKESPANPGSTFFVMTLFNLSGFLNAMLFTLTRATLIQGPGLADEADRMSALSDNPVMELKQMPATPAPAECRCRIHPESLGIREEQLEAPEAGPSGQPFRRQASSESTNVDRSPFRYQRTQTARSTGVV
ncbi:hypothetical protein JAAARDRAFT_80279 [Jaapia argillacea MUCL 33604]|uniref:Glucose receptor Git3 N-terminal domain-containing protein n=1 Tax=Jaapia argillacea MUCL 33604 TaxID=933084 RepID=A0A067PIG2_9AGAM|nr:hypothetical protein JAAARDRAFT_80279 [Jaapia argillacea MUCL 33604]